MLISKKYALFTKIENIIKSDIVKSSFFGYCFVIARSSNGRTFASEAEYLGPNPSLAAVM